MFFVVKRATLLIPSGPAHDLNRKHLFICLTDPVPPERETLIVSVSTLRQGEPHDPTCRLFAGDHPFVKTESYVHYRFARIEPADKLEKGVRQGLFVPREVMDGAVFARACKGVEESRFVTDRVLKFYRERTQGM